MRTLLLSHREISSWVITLFVVLMIGLVCADFYQSTHQVSQKGNAPLTLRVVALPQKVQSKTPQLSKPSNKISKTTPKKQTSSQSHKQPSPKPQTQKIQTPSKPNTSPKDNIAKAPQSTSLAHDQSPQSSQDIKDIQEEVQNTEGETIEMIANAKGEHFELYEKVHSAILKNVFYPKRARYKRLTGVVVVEFVLEKNGSITQEQIIRSSGYALLDESALKALSQTQFPTTSKKYRFRVPLRYG